VLSDKVEELKKTKEAVTVLHKLKVWPDIEKVCRYAKLYCLLNNNQAMWTNVLNDEIFGPCL
jgi:ribosomal protein L4